MVGSPAQILQVARAAGRFAHQGMCLSGTRGLQEFVGTVLPKEN